MRKKTGSKMQIECPECAVPIVIADNQQVEGEIIGCLNCAAELVLTREMDDDTGTRHWILAKLEEESDDER